MRLDGQQIGRYHFERFIGGGGTGDVYLATDPRIQQQVAVKVLQEATPTYPSSAVGTTESFRREASAIAQFRHPHIVPLYDYDETSVDGQKIVYLVMPFYRDGSLANWLAARGTGLLPLDTVAYFIQQAADALQYAHNHAIIHGDVKPSNFIVDTSANAQRPDLLLADFGISRFLSSDSSGTQSLGTLTYMAPEQFDKRPISFASDQYSLAIMTYELLIGRPPFQGPPGDLIRQHLSEQPVRPSAANAHLPRAVDNVILRALDKRPENRYPNVTDFARALQQALQPRREAPRGNDMREVIYINPTEAYNGIQRTITLPGGRQVPVRVPPRAYNGQVLTLPGLGEPPTGGGPAGNLLLTVAIAERATPAPPPPPRPQQVGAQFIAPQPRGNNRALWITLAVIGGVLLLLCILVFLVALIAAANAPSSSTLIATPATTLTMFCGTLSYNSGNFQELYSLGKVQ